MEMKRQIDKSPQKLGKAFTIFLLLYSVEVRRVTKTELSLGRRCSSVVRVTVIEFVAR